MTLLNMSYYCYYTVQAKKMYKNMVRKRNRGIKTSIKELKLKNAFIVNKIMLAILYYSKTAKYSKTAIFCERMLLLNILLVA